MANAFRWWRRYTYSIRKLANWKGQNLQYTWPNTPGLEQTAHHALIGNPNKTSDALETLIFNKDTNLVISAKICGKQQSSSRTSADSTDSRFTNIEKTLNEISNLFENHQINVTYDPNNPKMKKKGFYSTLHIFKKNRPRKKNCWSMEKKLMEKKDFVNWRKHIRKIPEPTKAAKFFQIEHERLLSCPKRS